jgi:hypothetical protein
MPRIIVALVIGLIGFAAYVAIAITVPDWTGPMHWAVQFLYFVVAGVLWVFPARWLMLWAAKR